MDKAYNSASNTLSPGAYLGGAAQKAESPIENQLSLLRSRVDELADTANDFQRRLSPVSQNELEVATPCVPTPGYGDCEVEQAIGRERDRVESLVRQLRGVLSRLRV